MIDVSIRPLVPAFILADQNGFALAKALEKAMVIFCETAQNGVAIINDVDKMPEWRLDEMAWELGCLYDETAEIESKREWIKNATPLYSRFGTPDAIKSYLDGLFSGVIVEENWEYGGDPYHFRILGGGELNSENMRKAEKAIAQIKNVRSVFDGFVSHTETTLALNASTSTTNFYSAMTGDVLCGTIPDYGI